MTPVVRCGIGLALLLFLQSCRGPDPHQATYAAEIRRTSFGIPHVKATDEAGLGYGMGYAYAQDNFCMFAEALVTVNGERSRYFGAQGIGGPDVETGSIQESNLHSDFFFQLLNAPASVEASWQKQRPEIKALLTGYAAGFNRYLADTTLARLPVACRNAAWVRKITERDLMKFVRRVTVEIGMLSFMKPLIDARPPTAGTTPAPRSAASLPWLERRKVVGSNGVALGKDATENGHGLLLGNPHYPWFGSLRFYQLHLTIPGKLDVMGVTLGGFPVVTIGFNEHFAWTHTVNTSTHFTLHELVLDERDPTKYIVDDKLESLEKRKVTVEVKDEKGALTRESHDFWISRYGPVIVMPGRLEWSAKTAYALHDANAENDRMVETWYAMNSARSLDEFETAVTTTPGIPWVNTLAASKDGETLFADVTVVPDLPQSTQDACVVPTHRKLIEDGLFVLKTGTACDPTGIFTGKQLPILRRTDFVQNSNDSAWMTNPAAPLTGFPPIVSAQDVEQNDRTRIGVSQIQARLAGADGLPGNRFNMKSLQQIAFSNRSYYGALLRDDLLKFCANVSADLQRACDIYRSWDGYANLTSVGYPLASQWINELIGQKAIWAVPFSPQDPINTPRGIKQGDAAVTRLVREALSRAVQTLDDHKIDATRPWGEIQGIESNGKRIPVPGGIDAYNAISGVMGDGFLNVKAGASYVQFVSFDESGPQAEGLLTYSQSTDPASPHFADQNPLFASLKWASLPYTDEAIRKDPAYRTVLMSE